MTTTTEKEIEQTLEKTEFGHLLLKNKVAMITAGVLVLVAIFAFTIVRQQQEKNRQAQLNKVFAFESGPFKKYQDGEIQESALIEELTKLKKEAHENPGLVPTLLSVVKELKRKGNSGKALEVVTSDDLNSFSKNNYAYYFLGMTRAVLLEDKGDLDGAISILENVLTRKLEILDAKIYLDLGRLYKLKGDKEKAKLNLDYVLANYPNDPLARTAGLYLNEL